MLQRRILLGILFAAIIVNLPAEVPAEALKAVDSPNSIYLPLVQTEGRPAIKTAWIGPGGGAITDLLFDPTPTANTAFAAASIGGIYKSTDGGVSWRNVSLGVEGLDITALGISASNPLVLYAGTYRGGLYKSVDHGESWTRYDAGFQAEAITYAIEVDPGRAKRVYVATRGQSNNGAPPWNGVVYKTEDGGTTWSPVLANVGGSGQEDWAYDLAIHPGSTQVVYAALHEHGAYRSTDYGGGWGAINSGITDLTGRASEPDPTSGYPGVVYYAPFERTGVFKSSNGGDSWTLKDDNLSNTQIYKLSIDPGNTAKIYLATFTDGVMKTTDGGNHWDSVGLEDEIILDVVVHPDSGNTLLSGTLHNGLFRSTNGGGSWSHAMTGLNASTVSSLAVRLGDSSALVASLTPGWVARSTDGGASWFDYHTGISDKYVHQLVTHPSLPQFLYALTESAGLYLRDTGGWESWIRVDENLPSVAIPTSKGFDYNSEGEPLTLALFDCGRILPALRSECFRSLADNEFGMQLSKGESSSDPLGNLVDFLFPESTAQPLDAKSLDGTPPLLAMVFAPTDPLTAYLGTEGSGIFKSDDDGASWTASGLSGSTVQDIAISPSNPELVFAATDGSGSVYLSPDGGDSWGNLLLPGVTAHCLAIPTTDPDTLYAGTSSGVYRFDGVGWAISGLAGFEVYDLAIHPIDQDTIYAATNNSAFISYDGGNNWELVTEELLGIRVESIRIDPNDPGVVYFTTQAHGVLRVVGTNPY